MKRRMQAGMETAAEKICRRVVLGLQKARNSGSDGALSRGPDLPAQAAAHAVSTFVELCPRHSRLAVGTGTMTGVADHAEDSVELLWPVAERPE